MESPEGCMTTAQAKALRVNDRVTWADDPKDAGTIIDNGAYAVTIKWDNHLPGTIDHRDAEQISRVPAQARTSL